MERLVDGGERDDQQTYDEGGLEEREEHSQKLVEPSEHDQFEDAFEQSAEETEDDEHCDEDDGEGYDLQNLLRRCDVLRRPCSDHVGESCRCPHACNDRYD